jgi:hypothetical protein
MEPLKELSLVEMKEISGGTNAAYEIGYAIGSLARKVLLFVSIRNLSKLC